MQRLEVNGAVRPLQWSLGVKGLTIPLAKPKQNAEEILKSYEPFLYGVTRCITNVFDTNVLQVATT